MVKAIQARGVKKPNFPASVPGTEPLWTVEDVSHFLRLTPETVRTMARRGELPSIKVGRRVWRFRSAEVKRWLKLKSEATSE